MFSTKEINKCSSRNDYISSINRILFFFELGCGSSFEQTWFILTLDDLRKVLLKLAKQLFKDIFKYFQYIFVISFIYLYVKTRSFKF